MLKVATNTRQHILQLCQSVRKQVSRMVCSIILLAIAAPLPAADMLYVSLGNNTIVSFDTTGNDGATIAATMSTFANTNLNNPQGLKFDSSGNLYVANAADNTISKFNASGGYVSNISTNLNSPSGLAFDSSGNLYATNYNGSIANTISVFNASGTYVSNIGSNLNGPSGLAFDSSGNLYAANFYDNTISKFNSSGIFLTSWSTGTASPNYLAFTVPEPSTYALATIATGVMAYLARRRKARTA